MHGPLVHVLEESSLRISVATMSARRAQCPAPRETLGWSTAVGERIQCEGNVMLEVWASCGEGPTETR
eukprot:scaffold144896_cov145-Phaeocystis_antarctica.AAC.1